MAWKKHGVRQNTKPRTQTVLQIALNGSSTWLTVGGFVCLEDCVTNSRVTSPLNSDMSEWLPDIDRLWRETTAKTIIEICDTCGLVYELGKPACDCWEDNEYMSFTS